MFPGRTEGVLVETELTLKCRHSDCAANHRAMRSGELLSASVTVLLTRTTVACQFGACDTKPLMDSDGTVHVAPPDSAGP